MIATSVITRSRAHFLTVAVAARQFRHEFFRGIGFKNIRLHVFAKGWKVLWIVNIIMPKMVPVSKIVFVVIPPIIIIIVVHTLRTGRQDGVHGVGQFRDKGISEYDHLSRPQSRFDIFQYGGVRVPGIQYLLNGFFGSRHERMRGV